MTELPEGLYERLITARLRDAVGASDLEPTVRAVDDADQAWVLSRYVGEIALRRLAAVGDTESRVSIVNRIVELLREPDEDRVAGAEQLLAMQRPAAFGRTRSMARRPATPLSDAALLTNAHGEPSIGAELRAELETADSVDLLCAFVKWHGLRVLEAELSRVRERSVPFRVLTTTYIGGTERAALDRLVRDFGAQVRVQYDPRQTRLHAKAWLFHRNTGYDTGYVGSSNLSRAALLDGVEWNVRLSRMATPSLLDKFAATFSTYWNDASFEDYDPDRDRDRLDDAIAEASGSARRTTQLIALSGLEVRPFPHQVEMLDDLDVERTVHGRHRNLVVAATGTGKTVVAALDYRRAARDLAPPSLLFVAHRKVILEQSLRAYREVLGDQHFGELWVGGVRPERGRHVFASIQSLSSYGVASIPTDHFETVVVDEFHHAESATYRALLRHLEPVELLGLTATPERTDGTDVRDFFGGRVASELRLWDALAGGLLSPFHYFGVADGTDLRAVRWTRGRYDEQALENLYTGNDARARIVLREVQDKIADPGRMRALAFCVSVAHAEYMAGVFDDAGIAAASITGRTPPAERTAILGALRQGDLQCVCAVDVLNEGVDIPDVDTVLFLRPTESATLFLQQLGRGLRRTPRKAVLTALDFVGLQRNEFRFDRRFRALTGGTRRELERQVDLGFPFLPSGTQIVLDPQTQAAVLDNLRSQVSANWRSLVGELRSTGDTTLGDFVTNAGIEFSDVVRDGKSWTRLRRDAGLATGPGGEWETHLLKRARALTHVDDPDRSRAYRALLADGARPYSSLEPAEQAFARMLLFLLWPGGGFPSFDDGLARLRREVQARAEFRMVLELAMDAAEHVTSALPGRLASLPLRVHARYQREEILAALGYATLSRAPSSHREGVLRSDELDVDAFLVTFKKSEADYSPTTMYRDYAISPALFHWESQSTTSQRSKTGRRYVNHAAVGSSVLLFARERRTSPFGTAPYLFLGSADYVSHAGERPMAITWRLDVPIPTSVMSVASVASA